jgi:hypothetical protein
VVTVVTCRLLGVITVTVVLSEEATEVVVTARTVRALGGVAVTVVLSDEVVVSARTLSAPGGGVTLRDPVLMVATEVVAVEVLGVSMIIVLFSVLCACTRILEKDDEIAVVSGPIVVAVTWIFDKESVGSGASIENWRSCKSGAVLLLTVATLDEPGKAVSVTWSVESVLEVLDDPTLPVSTTRRVLEVLDDPVLLVSMTGRILREVPLVGMGMIWRPVGTTSVTMLVCVVRLASGVNPG